LPSSYSIVYSFGDSLADAGNAWLLTNSAVAADLGQSPEPLSPPYKAETYAGGLSAVVFSNGPTSVQDISTDLGLGQLAPSGVDVPVSTLESVVGTAAANLIVALLGTTSDGDVKLAQGVSPAQGGTDFAIGGAVTGFTPENGVSSQLTDLNSQFATFVQNVGAPLANALYTVTIGSNDLLGLLEDPNYSTFTPAQITGAIAASVINEVNFVGSLVADGAKNILVQNVPDLGLTPLINDEYPSEVAAASQDALEYDNALATDLGTISGATITIENFYTLLDQAVADPSAFGLSNVTAPVYSGSIGEDNGPVVSTDPAVQDTYLFFDMLHPTETGHTAVANLALADLAASCFAEGTRIATSRGLVPIEALRVGDRVRTVLAGRQRVIWIGRRAVDCRRHPNPPEVWPVRIRADAYGPGVPERDLYLSPDHAVFAEDALIPVKYLIDGAAIAQVEVDRITYWHVELPRHDAILAEGLAAESYLDTGQRHAFEGGPALMLHPNFSTRVWDAQGCAPLTVCGPAVERAKARLRRAA
jgi:phospholipase/lecithinase/hemolysin